MKIIKSNIFWMRSFLVFLFLGALPCYGQYTTTIERTKKADSIQKLLSITDSHATKVEYMNKLGKLYLTGKSISSKDKDSASAYAEKIIKLGKQINNSEIITRGFILQADIFQSVQEYDLAIVMLNKEIKEAEKNKADKPLALFFEALGKIYRDKGFATGKTKDLLESELCFNNALNYGKDILDTDKIVEISLALASVLYYTYKNEESTKVLLNIVNQFEEDSNLDPILLSNTFANLAMNYRKLDQDEKAISFAQRVLRVGRSPSNTYLAYKILGQISEKNNNLKRARGYYGKALLQIEEVDTRKVYNLLERLGNMTLELKDYNNSVTYYQKAIESSKQFPEAYSALSIPSQYGLGQAYYQNEQFDESKKIISKIIKFLSGKDDNLEHLKYREILRDSYLLMSQLTEKDQEFKLSLRNYKEFAKIQARIEHRKDSIYKLEKLKTIKELELAFETEKKDKEISILKVNGDLQKLENAQQRNFMIGLTVGILLLLTLLFMVFKAFRLKQNAHKTIKEKYKENKLLMGEIHHRVKNNLQIIISLLNAQINGAKGNKVLQVALKESQVKVKSMAIIHQSLYNSQTYTSVNVHTYFEELLNEMKKTFETKGKIIQFKTDVEQREINMSLAIPIGLIINELVTNSYKYAFTDRNNNDNKVVINFNITDKPNIYKLLIMDNGVGLSDDFDIEKLSSFGMQLVKGLVDQLHGTINIINKQGAGYEIVVEEPQAA